MDKILIVEDDRALSEGVSIALKNLEIQIIQSNNLADAETVLINQGIDLVLLDIHLPDGNGLEFLKKIKHSFNIPVILLTANDTEMDIVLGLEYGANDYITKPFSLAVLRARVNTQLRRKQEKKQELFVMDEFVFDFNKMIFSKNKQSVELSKTEQKLLRILIENRGITVMREKLLDQVWGNEQEFIDGNTLSVTIKRLRDKLDAVEEIKTIYGLGYSWRWDK
ncbi:MULTISPECIES: response regulator transcription factor [Enterococcus]|uniref:Response regulator transcription factor n=1 Tax=Enterococcus alishanensis TaxID=1303817 RepID=A0ABS6TDJ7_9ENTE|nr:response regulator transcription factor [Enterococcus alishanensis]MBV7390985.1 response regulator transcription factor [Enterococcus alishanensis]